MPHLKDAIRQRVSGESLRGTGRHGPFEADRMVDDATLRKILLDTRTIAVVGCSKDPLKEAHRVPAYLQANGYRIIPVNPTADTILGETAFKSLDDIREPYDLVEIFRPSEHVPPFVDQALRGPAKTVWMQTGISNDEAARKAEAAGRIVVQDRCMRTEHMRLLGGLPGS